MFINLGRHFGTYLFLVKWSLFNHYIKIIVVYPFVRYGRSAETIWPWETKIGGCISGHWTTEARTGYSLWPPAIALATGTNTSFWMDYTKTRQQWTLTFGGPQLHVAKEFDSWEDIVRVIIREVVHFEGLEFLGQLIDLAMCSNRMS